MTNPQNFYKSPQQIQPSNQPNPLVHPLMSVSELAMMTGQDVINSHVAQQQNQLLRNQPNKQDNFAMKMHSAGNVCVGANPITQAKINPVESPGTKCRTYKLVKQPATSKTVFPHTELT